MLAEAIGNAGYISNFALVFHCECSPIERFWGAGKKISHHNCNCNYKSLDNYINGVSPAGGAPLKIRRYFIKSFRFIEAYSKGTEAFAVAKEFSKQQKSHRKLRDNQ